MKTKCLFLTVCACFLLVSCGEENSQNIPNLTPNIETSGSDDEYIASLWYVSEGEEILDMIVDEQQLDRIVDILLAWDDMPQSPEASGRDFVSSSRLPTCSGYWGNYQMAGKAEYQTSGYSYYWSPNCYFSAPGDDCGTDHDDNMISFWMGPDYSSEEAAYKVCATTTALRLYLYWYKGASYRLYISNAYGNWYGNAYVCLSNKFDPSTLRFGRDY